MSARHPSVRNRRDRIRPATRFRTAGVVGGITLLAALFALPAGGLASGIVVFDAVAVRGGDIHVKVFTGTGPFAAGGVRVWLAVEGEPETLILTGADGFGYWKTPAEAAGRFTVRARTRQSGASGTIRVLAPDEKPVLVEVESGLGLRRTLGDAGALTRSALEAIADVFPLVYWSGTAGLTASRTWIRHNGCPEAPILIDSLEGLDRRLERLGVTWQAAIGGDPLLEALGDRTASAFSFEKTEAGQQVETWQDVREALLP